MHKILLAILLAGTATTQANAAPTDRPDQQVKDTKAKQAHQGRAEGQRSRQTQPSGTDRRYQNKQTGQGNSRAQVTHSNAQLSGVDRRVPNKQEGQANNRAQAAHPNAQARAKVQATETESSGCPAAHSKQRCQPTGQSNAERAAHASGGRELGSSLRCSATAPRPEPPDAAAALEYELAQQSAL